MYKQKKHTFSKILGTTLALALVLGGTVGILNRYEHPQTGDEVNDDQEVVIKNDGVTLKLLSKTNNSYGEQDQVFSYSVSPANATNQAATAAVKYQDGTDCSAVMVVSVDTTAKTIKLSCKAAFSKKITLTVTSSANSSAKATATINYEKKLKSITAKSPNIQLGGTGTISGSVKKDRINWTDFYTPNYSVYTIDKNYTFTTALFGNGGADLELDECTVSSISTVIQEKFEGLLRTAITNQTTITDDQIWNLDSSNTYHSALMSASATGYISFGYQLKTTSSDGKEAISNNFIYIGLGRNWTGRTVGVDTISLEGAEFKF